MKRLLLTIRRGECPFRCRYCFAQFSQYGAPPSLEDLEAQPWKANGVDFIYPACDVDVFALKDSVAVLRRAAQFGRSMSVSTKAKLSPGLVDELADLDTDLRRRNCFLKVGVSFATRDSIAEIEPGTADFDRRVENLKLLQEASIPSCALIKPVLPEVDSREYFAILDSAAAWTKNVVLGDLYLDSADHRVHSTPTHADSSPLSFRQVGWATNRPIWPVIADAGKQRRIIHHAHSLGMRSFNSDLMFMSCLRQTLEAGTNHGNLAHAA